ncbi:hypothetical protein [Lacisediminimonas sp.]|uniref:hypothetical protein n=1 Tax=Lacisediminimonas sp. TaxID=3060582 RepID=UPI00272551F5|nr:hypothetical protein [Lacisediminimonas sp.]MDO8298951.1 hypothetical protein [Lacisediminimonas sp.]
MQPIHTRPWSRLALAAATAMLLASCTDYDDPAKQDMSGATDATKDPVVIERVAGLGTEPVAQN